MQNFAVVIVVLCVFLWSPAFSQDVLPLSNNETGPTLLMHYGHTGETVGYNLPPVGEHHTRRDGSGFSLFFADTDGVGWKDSTDGPARQACLTATVAFVLDRIRPISDHPTLRIYVAPASSLGGFLATAGSTTVFYGNYYSVFRPFGANSVQLLLQQGVDILQSLQYHAIINWDFSYSYFIPAAGCGVQVDQPGGDSPGSQTDFWSVALHELTHVLGFGSWLSYGVPTFYPRNPPLSTGFVNETYTNSYTNSTVFPFNTVFEQGFQVNYDPLFAMGTAMVNSVFHNEYIGPQDAAIANQIFYSGLYSHQREGKHIAIRSTSPYIGQTSLSHWDGLRSTDRPAFVMKSGLPSGIIVRYWGLAEGGVIRDLLYLNALTDNDECDASSPVVFGHYAFPAAATPSSSPTSASCDTFLNDAWYVFIPYWESSTTSISMSFSAPLGLAIYELCTSTTSSTQIACSSDSTPVILPFCLTAGTCNSGSSFATTKRVYTQINIRVNLGSGIPGGSLVVSAASNNDAVGLRTSSPFPAFSSNEQLSVSEINQFEFNSQIGTTSSFLCTSLSVSGSPRSIWYTYNARVSGVHMLYIVTGATGDAWVYSPTGPACTFANSATGQFPISMTAGTSYDIAVVEQDGSDSTPGHLRIYEPHHASCASSLYAGTLGRYTFNPAYLPPQSTTVCSQSVKRVAWLSFVAPVDGIYSFASCGNLDTPTLVAVGTAGTCTASLNPALTCPSALSCGQGSQISVSMSQGQKVWVAIAMLATINDLDTLPSLLKLDILLVPEASCSSLITSGSGFLDSQDSSTQVTAPVTNVFTSSTDQWYWKRYTPCPGFDGTTSWNSSYSITSIKMKLGWCSLSAGSAGMDFAIYLDPSYSGDALGGFSPFKLLGSGSVTVSGASGSCSINSQTVVLPSALSWDSPGDIWVGWHFQNNFSGVCLSSPATVRSFLSNSANSLFDPLPNGVAPLRSFPNLNNFLVALGITATTPTSTTSSSTSTSSTSWTSTSSTSTSSTSTSTSTSSPSTSSTSTSTPTSSTSTSSSVSVSLTDSSHTTTPTISSTTTGIATSTTMKTNTLTNTFVSSTPIPFSSTSISSNSIPISSTLTTAGQTSNSDPTNVALGGIQIALILFFVL